MELKRMACILDEETVLERVICPVCDTIYFMEGYANEYFDYMNKGPIVGRYDGWDDIPKVTCEGCFRGASFFFGDKFIMSLLKEGDIDVVDFLAIVSRLVRDCITAGRKINGSGIRERIEKHTFTDGSQVKFMGGNWVLVRSETRLKYGIRPVNEKEETMFINSAYMGRPLRRSPLHTAMYCPACKSISLATDITRPCRYCKSPDLFPADQWNPTQEQRSQRGGV